MKDKILRSKVIIPKELYVKRDADKQIKRIIEDMGRPGYILVARQMGKTNLLINAKRELEDEENIYVYVDLSNPFENSRNCFRNIIDKALKSGENVFIKAQNAIYKNREVLKLPPHIEHERELSILLEATRGKVVIFLDEIGSLTNVPFSDEIFTQIRSIYFSRVNFKEFERLTYILAGVAEPSELIKNKNISPFNIGEKIYLDDFNHKEFMTFLKQANLNLSNDVAERVFYWASGNPRITWDLCSELEDVYIEGTRLTVKTVDDAVKKLYLTTVNKAPVDHIRNEVRNDKEIRDAVILIKNNKGSTLSNEEKNKLYLTGIIKSGYHSKEAILKNKVIEKSLTHEWLISTEHYPLSQAQLRLWRLSQLNIATALYNMSFAFVMEGKLDYRAFEKALHEIVQRHETLRTTIINVDGKPWQKVHVKIDVSIDKINLNDEENPQPHAYTLARESAVKPFDLVEGPLFRIVLFELPNDHYIFLFVVHNIVFDNFSINILLEELSHIYRCSVEEVDGSLKPLDHQYRDFAKRQNSLLENKLLDIHRDYWFSILSGEIPVLSLPWDFPRPQERSLNAHLAKFSLDVKALKNLHEFCREEKIALFAVILTILKILFYRYTGQEEILLGISTSGRNNTTLKTQIGLYENKLVLRDLIKGGISFVDFLKQVRQTEQEARDHKEYPFEKLLLDLEIPITPSHTPLFNVMVEYKSIDEINTLFHSLRLSPFNINLKNNDYDLTFTFIEMKDRLMVKIEYSNDLFLKPTIERVGKHFIRLITNIVSDGKERKKPIDHLIFLSDKELEEILLEFNNTEADYPRDKTIIDIFEEQVLKTPDNTAIVFEEVQISYSGLNRLVNRIANFLRDNYIVKPDDPVVLLVKISEWAVIGLLGVLKAGGAYVPIDVDWPETKIINILHDLNCNLVLVDDIFYKSKSYNRLKSKLGNGYHDDRFVNIMGTQGEGTRDYNPLIANQPQNLAYIIYPVDTTGGSRGVMIEHHSVVNLIQAIRQKVFRDFEYFLHIFFMTSLSFDISVLEILSALLQGHSLHIATQEIKVDIYALGLYLEQHSIDIMNLKPSIFKLLVDEWLSKNSRCTLKHMLLGGEIISLGALKSFYSKPEHQDVSISYTYGPAECTVVSVLKSLNKESINLNVNLPIGVPLDNTEVYILGEHHQLLPVGAAGEICISGEGVTRGYINMPGMLAKRMVPHPLKEGKLLYRTGDPGRWMLNNDIEYLGGIDSKALPLPWEDEDSVIRPIKKILILSANPRDSNRLHLDEEIREIEEGLLRSKYRDRFSIQSKWAVRLRDIRRAILDYEPQIVHFCGFGEEDGLKVEDERGKAVLIQLEALSVLFELFAEQIECVLLNGHFSELQAEAINKHVDYVIGMNQKVQPKTAIEFAVGFYEALGAGKPVEDAFSFGQNALQMYSSSKSLSPVLYKNPKHRAQREKKSVFLCYSHKDKTLYADRLARDLKKYGMKVWYDKGSVLPGEPLFKKISEGIQDSDYFIVLLTPNSIYSNWVNYELALAFNRYNKEKTRIIPIIFGDCSIPDFLKSFIYVDFRKGYASGLKELLRVFGIESQIFSESEVKKLILRIVPSDFQAYITKYVLAKDNSREEALKEAKQENLKYLIAGVVLLGYFVTWHALWLVPIFGVMGALATNFGIFFLGVYSISKYFLPKNTVKRYFKLLSNYEELMDMAPDIHLKNSISLYYELLVDNDRRFYRKYHISENDIDKSLNKCKLWYSILGVLDLIVFIVLLIFTDLIPEKPDIITFFKAVVLLLGLYLFSGYKMKSKKINEMYKSKKYFERIREVFIND